MTSPSDHTEFLLPTSSFSSRLGLLSHGASFRCFDPEVSLRRRYVWLGSTADATDEKQGRKGSAATTTTTTPLGVIRWNDQDGGTSKGTPSSTRRTQSIPIHSITAVLLGTQTQAFHSADAQAAADVRKCFTIRSANGRELNLEAESEEQRSEWTLTLDELRRIRVPDTEFILQPVASPGSIGSPLRLPSEYKEDEHDDSPDPFRPPTGYTFSQRGITNKVFFAITKWPSICMVLAMIPSVVSILLLVIPRWTIDIDLTYGQFVLDGDIDGKNQNAWEAAQTVSYSKQPPTINWWQSRVQDLHVQDFSEHGDEEQNFAAQSEWTRYWQDAPREAWNFDATPEVINRTQSEWGDAHPLESLLPPSLSTSSSSGGVSSSFRSFSTPTPHDDDGGTDLHPLSSPASSDGRSHLAETLVLLYWSDDNSNLLTNERIAAVHDIETALLKVPGFQDHCRLNPSTYPQSRCAPSNSLLNFLYPRVSAGQIIFDGSGSEQIDVQPGVVLLLQNGRPGFFSRSTTERNPTSSTLISTFQFGVPLDGRGWNDIPQQRAEIRAWMGTLESYLSSVDDQHGFRVLREGGDLFAVEIRSTLYRDAVTIGISVFVIFAYMIYHTRSFFLTVAALFQMAMSFPPIILWYRWVFGDLMNVMNVVSVWIILGVGCDDVFVFHDTWLQHRWHSTSGGQRGQPRKNDEILATQLKWTWMKSCAAMLVTSLTTAVGFYSTAISRLLPLREFGFFLGGVVVMNYLLMLTWFPAVVVLHEKWKCHCCSAMRERSTSHWKERKQTHAKPGRGWAELPAGQPEDEESHMEIEMDGMKKSSSAAPSPYGSPNGSARPPSTSPRRSPSRSPARSPRTPKPEYYTPALLASSGARAAPLLSDDGVPEEEDAAEHDSLPVSSSHSTPPGASSSSLCPTAAVAMDRVSSGLFRVRYLIILCTLALVIVLAIQIPKLAPPTDLPQLLASDSNIEMLRSAKKALQCDNCWQGAVDSSNGGSGGGSGSHGGGTAPSCPISVCGDPASLKKCEGILCQNGGRCNAGVCQCTPGWQGTLCQSVNPCYGVNCHQGYCTTTSTGQPQCNCLAGYQGSDCSQVSVCYGYNCHQGYCVDNAGQAQCKCFSGYQGTDCSVPIPPVVRSSSSTAGPRSSSSSSSSTGGIGPFPPWPMSSSSSSTGPAPPVGPSSSSQPIPVASSSTAPQPPILPSSTGSPTPVDPSSSAGPSPPEPSSSTGPGPQPPVASSTVSPTPAPPVPSSSTGGPQPIQPSSSTAAQRSSSSSSSTGSPTPPPVASSSTGSADPATPPAPISADLSLRIQIVWGVSSVDMSAADVDNRGVPIFSPTFNLEDGAAQIHLANACADLMNRTDIRPSPASRCIMEAFRRSHQHLGLPFPSTSIVRDLIAWLKSNGDNWYEDVGFELKQKVDAHPSKIVKGRPLSREHHSLSFSALAQHGSLHSEERILNAASEYRVSYIRGTVLTYIDKSLGGVQMKPNYDRWEDWMDGWNARAPAMAGPGFQASGEWSRMRVELAFISGTISSISISVATVAVTILVFTHNAWLMLFTVGCILCIVACLLGLFVVWGWSLGALEAISVPLVVGLSVDYALHLGHSYNHAGSADPDDPTHKPSFDRVARMRAALIQIGPSVVSAAATTIGAMFVLYFCQIHVFKEIGIIVSVTLLLGIYFSICVFSALCFMFGPEGDQGNVIGWMRNARKWAEDKWNERKENHRRVQSDSPAAETMAAEPEYTRERMEA